MAMSPKERDEKRRAKAARLQEEDLRLKVRPGTKHALLELMEWAGIEEQGEAMTLMIHHIEALGHHALFRIARHEIEGHRSVARSEVLRLNARLRTSQHLATICGWADLSPGRMMEALIHGVHALGEMHGAKFITPPRHQISISPRMALAFDRKSMLMIKQDPGDEVVRLGRASVQKIAVPPHYRGEDDKCEGNLSGKEHPAHKWLDITIHPRDQAGENSLRINSQDSHNCPGTGKPSAGVLGWRPENPDVRHDGNAHPD